MPIRKIVIATNKKSKTAKRPVVAKPKGKLPVVKKPSNTTIKSTNKPTPTAARTTKQAKTRIVRVSEQLAENEPFQETVAETHPVVAPVVDAGGAVIMTPVEHIEVK